MWVYTHKLRHLSRHWPNELENPPPQTAGITKVPDFSREQPEASRHSKWMCIA